MRQSINEWQDMGLKKDVENISKQLQNKRSYEKPLVLELYITVITLIVDKIFDYADVCKDVQMVVLCALLFVATIIFIYVLFVYIRDYLMIRSNIKKSIYNIKPYIDLFDNNICYYALTASNFYENLIGNNLSEEETNKHHIVNVHIDKCQFYYIETQYYINKCISELSKMENVYCDVFSDDVGDVVFSSKIHFSRLKNIVDLMSDIRENLYNNKTIVNNEESNHISEKYDEIIEKFINNINMSNKFSVKLKWITREKTTN